MLSRKYADYSARRPTIRLLLAGARWIWRHLPRRFLLSRAGINAGKRIHQAVVRYQPRIQSHYTRFFRNRPLMEKVRDIALQHQGTEPLTIASVGCSSGAEVYTLLYLIRSQPRAPRVTCTGLDLMPEIIRTAEQATYEREAEELSWLTPTEISDLFDPVEHGLKVNAWIRADTQWIQADALNPFLVDEIGPVDILMANNFLGPMSDEQAAACFRNIVRLAKPGGVVVVDGMDLNVKEKLVREAGLVPVTDHFDRIFESDPSKSGWPWQRWGHEPIDRNRPAWRERYAVVFRRT